MKPTAPLRALSQVQQALLLHLRGQLLVERRPPTYRELGLLVGIVGEGVAYHIKRLEEMGYVRRTKGASGKAGNRTLQLVDVGAR